MVPRRIDGGGYNPPPRSQPRRRRPPRSPKAGAGEAAADVCGRSYTVRLTPLPQVVNGTPAASHVDAARGEIRVTAPPGDPLQFAANLAAALAVAWRHELGAGAGGPGVKPADYRLAVLEGSLYANGVETDFIVDLIDRTGQVIDRGDPQALARTRLRRGMAGGRGGAGRAAGSRQGGVMTMERKKATAAYAVTVLDGRQIVNGKAFDAVVDRTDRTAKVTGSDGRQKLAERAFIAGWEAASMEREADAAVEGGES